MHRNQIGRLELKRHRATDPRRTGGGAAVLTLEEVDQVGADPGAGSSPELRPVGPQVDGKGARMTRGRLQDKSAVITGGSGTSGPRDGTRVRA